ncbi:MAG: hypothetical protein WC565_08280, partial [Parcubacteria group bacterium]
MSKKPWTVETSRRGDVTIHSEDGKQIEVVAREPVGSIGGTTAAGVEASKEVAAYIVSRVNAHGALVKAVKKLLHWAEEPSVALDAAAEFEDALKEG